MEMWDGSLPMYAQGEGENKTSEVVVGSKIVITKPDSSSRGRGVSENDIGKVVHIHVDRGNIKRYLAYNPNWTCRKDGMRLGLEYGGLFIVFWEKEFKVI